jgi:hypothetical protein
MAGGKARLVVLAAGLALGALTLAPMMAGGAGTAAGPAAAPAPAPVPAPIRNVPPKPAPSSVVYPAPLLPLRFDHARHARAGATCERCHAGAARSQAVADNLSPGEDACRSCHEIDRTRPDKVVAPGKPAARCDACHPGYRPVTRPPVDAGLASGAATAALLAEPPRVVVWPAALKLNHRLHAERGVGCEHCHAGVAQLGAGQLSELPSMALCLACHDGRQATSRCAACHPTLPDGRLRTSLPGGKLVPSGSLRGSDAHTSSFRLDHKVAGRDQRYCATCHQERECQQCHAAGVVRPSDFHPLDYATMHAVDGRRNVPDCSGCHRNQTFCVGCHQRLGVSADAEGGQPGRQPQNPFGTGTRVKQFHPAGWARDGTGQVITTPSPSSHSVQARRNLRACVSCHRESSCLECHSTDPGRMMNINPHPTGFAGSGRCRALAARNVRACLKCHAPGAAELDCR